MKDPGSLTLPCRFGNSLLTNGLADSGASINVMPYSFYKRLKLTELKPTRMAIHLANKSVTHPRGIVEDILVRVDKFVIPADFVIIDMEEDKNVPILLGRPFLATAGTLIDVRDSKLTLRVGDESITFEMDKSTNDSNSCDNTVFSIETVNFVVQETIDEVEEEEKQIQGNGGRPEEESLDARQEIEELEKLLEEEVEVNVQDQVKEHAPWLMRKDQIFRIDAKVDEFDETLNKDLEELLGYSLEEEEIEEECDSLVISDLTPHTHPQDVDAVQENKIQNSQEDNQEAEENEKSIQELTTSRATRRI